jgi:RNA recognition motif. (a.k.a. RRM, RBD, or RNP domain)
MLRIITNNFCSPSLGRLARSCASHYFGYDQTQASIKGQVADHNIFDSLLLHGTWLNRSWILDMNIRHCTAQYDGSGRSTGTAVVTFETAAEATRAKNQFDGILAKGQSLCLVYSRFVADLIVNARPTYGNQLPCLSSTSANDQRSIHSLALKQDREAASSRTIGQGRYGHCLR